jgi:cation diffusion facilitator family transporter
VANQESVGTVLVAGAANLGIAIAKAIAGVISGSSAMLSEAAHSFADTVTEALLFTALRRGDQPPDARHPLGYGREVYVWALLASVATFVGGAVFSVTDGIRTLVRGEQLGDPLLAFLVLAISFVLEGTSLLRGLHQSRGEAERHHVPLTHYVRRTPDTTVKAVVFEDSAALIGVLLAAGGLALVQLTGSNVWDGIASLAIGVLLAAVAFELGRSNISMLVGQSLPQGMRQQLVRDLEGLDDVETVVDLAAVVQGPQEVLVAAKVHFRVAATAAQIEARCEQAERQLQDRYPQIVRVYLDPTPHRPPSGPAPSDTPPSDTPPSGPAPSDTPPSGPAPSDTPPSGPAPSDTPPSGPAPSGPAPSGLPPSGLPPSGPAPSETAPTDPSPSEGPPSGGAQPGEPTV